MLDVDAGVLAALEADHAHFAWTVELGTGPETLFWTTHASDVMAGGQTYVSAAYIEGLPAIVREREIKLQSYTLRLVGADRVFANSFHNTELTGTPVVVSLALLDGAGGVIGGDVIQLYKGTVESWRESESADSATIELKITSPWFKPSQIKGRITSTSAQQDRYAGDRFFEFAHVEKSNLGWGGKA